MFNDIILSIIQSVTEFLPISSSGHLALASNLISEPDLFFFTILHLASLIAVVIFTRKEIKELLSFKAQYRKIWLYLIVATIPAAAFGFFFKDVIEKSFSSLLFIGGAFFFTGIVLFLTKFAKQYSNMNGPRSLLIGIFQILALFPGVSRSGMTISSALFLGIDREKAVKFSFLLFIPLSLGAFILEMGEGIYFSFSLALSFFICLILSLAFLNVLLYLAKKGKLWAFSIYCCIISVTSICIYYLKHF